VPRVAPRSGFAESLAARHDEPHDRPEDPRPGPAEPGDPQGDAVMPMGTVLGGSGQPPAQTPLPAPAAPPGGEPTGPGPSDPLDDWARERPGRQLGPAGEQGPPHDLGDTPAPQPAPTPDDDWATRFGQLAEELGPEMGGVDRPAQPWPGGPGLQPDGLPGPAEPPAPPAAAGPADRPWPGRPGTDQPGAGPPWAADQPRADRPWAADQPPPEQPWAADQPRPDQPWAADRPRPDQPWGADRLPPDQPRADRPRADQPWADRPQSGQPAQADVPRAAARHAGIRSRGARPEDPRQAAVYDALAINEQVLDEVWTSPSVDVLKVVSSIVVNALDAYEDDPAEYADWVAIHRTGNCDCH
jgi:hypothetical protein